MGLFNKKEKESLPSLPRLPELPSLPSPPNFSSREKIELHELPSFPTNNFGEKYSQNTIKNAVSGDDEEDDELEENFNFPTFPEKIATMSSAMPSQRQELMPKEDFEKMIPKKVISQEPVFIRIDKFEESMNIFKKIKKNMGEIEELLKETKDLKSKEERELSLWESEIQQMKSQIENIDKDIFSKI